MPEFIPVRPDIPLLAILLYALVAFIIGSAAPAYYRFLLRFKLGKQLRCETVDGRCALLPEVPCRKAGTPTMEASHLGDPSY